MADRPDPPSGRTEGGAPPTPPEGGAKAALLLVVACLGLLFTLLFWDLVRALFR